MKPRILQTGTKNAPFNPKTQKERQDRYYVNLIKNHPKLSIIISSIREGVVLTEIARYFALQGWITINERTFVEALRTFKRAKTAIIDGFDMEGLDLPIDPNRPELNELSQLQQLYRFQKKRLAIGHKLEATGFLLEKMPKEVEVAGELLEKMARLSGKITDTRKNIPGTGELTSDVTENLNRIKKDESTRNRIHGLVKQVVS